MNKPDLNYQWELFKASKRASTPEHVRYHQEAERVKDNQERQQAERLAELKQEWESVFGKGTW